MMDEVWRDVVGYEGLYQVSDQGNVRSTWRYRTVLRPRIDKDGYRTVQLYRNGHAKHFRVARLVALAFVRNPDNKPVVNHIDMDRANDSARNLEWCTDKENVGHSMKHDKYVGSRHVPVLQCKDGGVVATWESMSVAARALGIQVSNISYCVSGERKHAGGYAWKRAE